MNNIQTVRFKDALWFPKEEMDTQCIVGGAGGIGSWLTLLLARAGFNPTVFDHDVLEEHNMGGQLYDSISVGKNKVVALSTIVKDFSGTEIDILASKYDETSVAHTYMFSGFDNMLARKHMFENFVQYVEGYDGVETPIYIDGRLSAEQLQIFCVTPDRIEMYKNHLFNDSEIEDAPCTLKQTSHAAAMIASHMVGFFTNHYANNVIGEQIREVPFKWEYLIPINYLSSV